MHSPSPQLLRALRSINAFAVRPSPRFNRRISTPSFHRPAVRNLSSTNYHSAPPPPSSPPKTHNRGPKSEEKTQTDFSTLNVLGDMPPPITAIDACLSDGFHLNNGVKISGGSGVMLVDGEAFAWTPWEAPSPTSPKSDKREAMINAKGQFEVLSQAWGLLEVVWPKPDLLILGLGANMFPIAPAMRKAINDLGIRVEVQDTRNAAAQFNLLATERGTQSVAAALVPIGFKVR